MRKWLAVTTASWFAVANWGGVAQAADAVIGSVLAVRGTVHVDTAGKPQQALVANAPLHVGDTIVSADGKAKVALTDGTVISVGENTRLRLAEHQQTTAVAVRIRINLIAGVARFASKIAPGGAFEVETETAIAAVRGTDWVMEVTASQTSVATVEGAVSVTSRGPGAQAAVVLEGEGQGTDVRSGQPPTPPVRWSAQRFASTLARATFD